jgi:hypothetical protein
MFECCQNAIQLQAIISSNKRQIDVAIGIGLIARERAEHKRCAESRLQRLERPLQYVGEANAANDELLKRFEYRRVRISLEVPVCVYAQYSAACQKLQLALHRSNANACPACYFPKVERFVRTKKG